MCRRCFVILEKNDRKAYWVMFLNFSFVQFINSRQLQKTQKGEFRKYKLIHRHFFRNLLKIDVRVGGISGRLKQSHEQTKVNPFVNHEWIRAFISDFFYLLYLSYYRSRLVWSHSTGWSSTWSEQQVEICTIYRTSFSCSWRSKSRGSRCSNWEKLPAEMRKEWSMFFYKRWSVSSTKRKCIVWVASHGQVQCVREVQSESYLPSLQYSGKCYEPVPLLPLFSTFACLFLSCISCKLSWSYNWLFAMSEILKW